jgi:hypothetical protein
MGHDLMTMVMETAAELGFLKEDPETKKLVPTGEGGAKGYLKWIGINRPDRFVALMARVAPKHVFADGRPIGPRSAKPARPQIRTDQPDHENPQRDCITLDRTRRREVSGHCAHRKALFS